MADMIALDNVDIFAVRTYQKRFMAGKKQSV